MRLDEIFKELTNESERRARECLELVRNCPRVEVSFRRHHNNKGYRQIKRDKCHKSLRVICGRLGLQIA